MEVTAANIAKEVRAWKKFPGHHAPDATVTPIEIRKVDPGSICRAWMAPNQSHFVVLGNCGTRAGHSVSVVVRDDGNAGNLMDEAWVVVVDGPPKGFPDLLGELAKFNQRMEELAWDGRPH